MLITDDMTIEEILGGSGTSAPPETPPRKAEYPCPCCGCITYPDPPEKALAYICPVCFWENDLFIKNDDEKSDENHGLTLNQARKNYSESGACDPRLLKYVRKPKPEEKNMWWKIYEKLDLRGGKIFYISDDCEDMLEISYPDGMFIDVGKSDIDGKYYVTAVSSNDAEGWKAPLAEISLTDKDKLFGLIQDTIIKFRK